MFQVHPDSVAYKNAFSGRLLNNRFSKFAIMKNQETYGHQEKNS